MLSLDRLTHLYFSLPAGESSRSVALGIDCNPSVFDRTPCATDDRLNDVSVGQNARNAAENWPKRDDTQRSLARRRLLTRQCEVSNVKNSAPRVGLEPTTNRLTAGCSTIELSGNYLRLPTNRLIPTHRDSTIELSGNRPQTSNFYLPRSPPTRGLIE